MRNTGGRNVLRRPRAGRVLRCGIGGISTSLYSGAGVFSATLRPPAPGPVSWPSGADGKALSARPLARTARPATPTAGYRTGAGRLARSRWRISRLPALSPGRATPRNGASPRGAIPFLPPLYCRGAFPLAVAASANHFLNHAGFSVNACRNIPSAHSTGTVWFGRSPNLTWAGGGGGGGG